MVILIKIKILIIRIYGIWQFAEILRSEEFYSFNFILSSVFKGRHALSQIIIHPVLRVPSAPGESGLWRHICHWALADVANDEPHTRCQCNNVSPDLGLRIRKDSEGQAQSALGTRATLRTFSVTEVIDLKISWSSCVKGTAHSYEKLLWPLPRNPIICLICFVEFLTIFRSPRLLVKFTLEVFCFYFNGNWLKLFRWNKTFAVMKVSACFFSRTPCVLWSEGRSVLVTLCESVTLMSKNLGPCWARNCWGESGQAAPATSLPHCLSSCNAAGEQCAFVFQLYHFHLSKQTNSQSSCNWCRSTSWEALYLFR